MPAPPGSTRTQTRTDHASGGKETAIGAALVTRYVHLAMSDPACAEMSVHRINKVVRRFIAAGQHERDLVSWLISYYDPTGETAVRNVMRARA